jgi:hypothetical protein
MTRGFLVIIAVFALLSACTQRMICPAYQSSFIYDKEALRQQFSYFKDDSTPRTFLTVNKDKYLIAVPESYRKTYRKMQTIEMKPIYPKKPDSLKEKKDDDMMLAELDSADSVSQKKEVEPGDSTYAITKTKEKYNLDQDLYMWYFREMLVLPDVRAAIENKDRKKDEPDAKVGADGKKEKVGFFKGIKNIFKKKPKSDSTAVKDASGKELPKKKSSLFKKKKKTSEPPKEKDPAKKEGDGF